MATIEVFKETKEDWCPSFITNEHFPKKLLEVRFTEIVWKEPTWRVSVWGNDDFGMEYDFDNEAKALDMFYKVIAMPLIEKKKLKKLGFVNA